MNSIRVTTSWDDGHILDLRLAELLRKYGLAGTFYIAPKDRQIEQGKRLSKEQVRELGNSFEIGAHTMTHPKLSTIDSEIAVQEIRESKKTLEEWTGKEASSFCYPSGDYTEVHKELVKSLGFKLARTVQRFKTEIGDDPFELPTTVHAYRHWADAGPILNEAGALSFIQQYLNWDKLAIALFDKVLVGGGIFHLWGHSWEIDKNKDWGRLEQVFKYIGRRSNIQYVINRQLV